MTIRRVTPTGGGSSSSYGADQNGGIRRPGGRTSPGEDGISERFYEDQNPNTYRPNVGGSGNTSTATKAPKEVTFSSTIFNSDIKAAYGASKVTGVCGFVYQSSNWLELMYAFAYGEQSAVTKVFVGDDELYPNNTIEDWIPYLAVRVGDGVNWGGGTRPPALLSAAEADRWKNLCHIYFAMRPTAGPDNLSGSLDVKALLGGQIITDFRDASTGAFTNPALVCYDIETNPHWRDNGSARLGVESGGTWEAVADTADEIMSDASKRYHFQGAVNIRNPDEVETEILKHCFADKYTSGDGKLQLFQRALPPAVSGTWTVAGTNVGGSGGAALTELEAGDIVYVGTSKGIIESVTNDNLFTVDRPMTETAETTRKTSGIYLKREDITGSIVKGTDIPEAQIPDDVVVRYIPEGVEGGTQYPKVENYTGDKRTEISLSGCKTAGMARRVSETQRNILKLQPFGWSFRAGMKAAALEPGDVFFFDDDVLTMQPARALIPVKHDLKSGTISIKAEEFDPLAYSEGVATDDTPPVLEFDPPDAPTDLTRVFGESGDWDSASMVSNPDDLTTSESWAYVGTMTSAYNGGTDETEFEFPALSGGTYAWKEFTSEIDGHNVLFVSLVIRALANWGTDSDVQIQYASGADHATATVQQSIRVTPFVDGRYQRSALKFTVTSDAHHEIRIRGAQAAAVTGGSEPTFGIKRFRAVAWGVQGEPISTVYGAGSIAHDLGIYERFEWVEHSSAPDTVQEYQLRINSSAGTGSIKIGSVAEGGNSIEVDHAKEIQRWGPSASGVARGGNAEYDRGFYMKAVGPTGRESIFPSATETFEGSATPPVLGWNRFALSYWWSYQTQAYENYTTFTYAPTGLIPTGTEDDYILEFWLNLDGGGLTLRKEVPLTTEVGYGPANSKVGEPGFVYTNAASVVYELWVRNKYTGKRTQMTENGYAANSGSPLPPNTPTLAVLNPIHTITNDHTDVFGVVTSTKILVLSWTNAADGGTTTDHYEIETRDSAVPAVITRHEYALPVNSTGQATSASWSDNIPATFPDEFIWPSGHNQMRVIAVGPLGEEAESNWGTPTVTAGSTSSSGSASDLNTQPLIVETTSGITTGYPKWIKVMSTSTRYTRMIIEFENGLYDITRQWSGRLIVQCEDTASAPVITYTLTADDSANGVLTVPFSFQVWYDSATGDTEVWLMTLSQHSRIGVRAWTQYHWNTEPNILTDWETDLSSTGPTAAGTYSKVWDQTTATPNFLFDGNGSKIEVDGTPLISRIQDASDVTITGLVWGDMLYWDGSVWRDISRYQIDNNAFHRAASSQISALTEKVTPVSADLIVIEDSAASNAKKKVQIGNLPSGGGGGSAPKTTSAVNLTGTCSTSGSTESTLVNVSSGPYIIHLISNTDGFDSGYIELVVDGTTLIAGFSGGGTLYPPGTVLVGAGSSYFPCPVFVRSSFSIKGLDNGPSFTYRIVYQAVSIS